MCECGQGSHPTQPRLSGREGLKNWCDVCIGTTSVADPNTLLHLDLDPEICPNLDTDYIIRKES